MLYIFSTNINFVALLMLLLACNLNFLPNVTFPIKGARTCMQHATGPNEQSTLQKKPAYLKYGSDFKNIKKNT